jgi:hypothetical protein
MSTILALVLSGAFAQAVVLDDAPTDPPMANAPAVVEEPAPQEDKAPAAQDAEVDQLLTKLENAAAELRDFTAKVRYDKWDPVTSRWEIRAGELIYQLKPDKSKRFAMLFDTLIVGDRRQERKAHFIFDAGWLVEVDHERKQFIKRQIVAPGQEFDPFKLGEGPFPLPVGQSRDEVLKHFEVTLLGKPEDQQLEGLENVKGLRLIPRPGAREAEHFERVDVFYDNDTLLPVGISLIETDAAPDDKFDARVKKIVRLRDVKRNEGIDETRLSIEEPDAREWAINIEPWRGE